MSLVATVLFVSMAIVVGIWLLKALVFGVGLGILLSIAALAVFLLTAIGFSGSFAFLLYLLIRLFMLLFVVGLVVGTIVWIKNVLFVSC